MKSEDIVLVGTVAATLALFGVAYLTTPRYPPVHTFTGTVTSVYIAAVHGPTGGTLGDITRVGWKLDNGQLWTQTILGDEKSLLPNMHVKVAYVSGMGTIAITGDVIQHMEFIQ